MCQPCDFCENLVDESNILTDRNGFSYCGSCWKALTEQCEVCGWEFHHDEMELDTICWRCYEEEEDYED